MYDDYSMHLSSVHLLGLQKSFKIRFITRLIRVYHIYNLGTLYPYSQIFMLLLKAFIFLAPIMMTQLLCIFLIIYFILESDIWVPCPKSRNASRTNTSYSSYLIRLQNLLLKRTLRGEKYLKLYSYHYLINGFAVLITPQQVLVCLII